MIFALIFGNAVRCLTAEELGGFIGWRAKCHLCEDLETELAQRGTRLGARSTSPFRWASRIDGRTGLQPRGKQVNVLIAAHTLGVARDQDP